MKELSRERVNELFYYDLMEGKLYWKQPSKYHKDLTNKEAGVRQASRGGKFYWVIQIDGVKYRRGRLIFFIIYGRLPYPCLDHINGNSLDDRMANIREATVMQNCWNHKAYNRRIKLPLGVRNVKSGNYEARISCNGKQIHLGCYPTPKEAHAVYMEKRKELYANFS